MASTPIVIMSLPTNPPPPPPPELASDAVLSGVVLEEEVVATSGPVVTNRCQNSVGNGVG